MASNVSFEVLESYVIVAVEIERLPVLNEILRINQYKTSWGQTAPYQDGVSILLTLVDDKSPRKIFAERKRKAMEKKERSADDLLDLAVYALNHRLLNECTAVLDDMIKTPNPAASDRVKNALSKYQEVRDNLAKPVYGSSTVDIWKKKLSNYGVAVSKEGHYVIFFSEQSKEAPPEVARRLDLLEQNMRAFYYWFALQGVVLPVSEEKLVAIQVQDPAAFRKQRDAANQAVSVTDGFFAPLDNVAVFSTQRLDQAYQVFSRNLQEMWQRGWKREDLLIGKDAPKDLKKGKEWRDEFKKCQTLALVDKALEHEAELAAVTHEGSRQLSIATGLYPRSVMAPEWIQFGFASLFDTPKGPYPGAIGTCQTAFWPICGSPNWAYVRPFKIWAASKDEFTKLDEPSVALRRTVGDYYFNNSRKEVDDNVDPTLPDAEQKQRQRQIARAKEEQFRARTMAWALTYFLAKHRTNDLIAYFDEISRLPRDLEFDEQSHAMAFARALKLTNEAGTDIDQAKWEALAKEWFGKMNAVELPGRDYALEKRKEASTPAGGGGFGPGGGPGGGFGPGGGPGGGFGPGGGPGAPGGGPGAPGGAGPNG